MEAYLSLAAFPDVKPGLEALKKQGVKLAILSNGETRMLEAAAKSAGIRDLLDDIISVEEVKIFKVSPRVYSLAPERMKVTNPELGFISANSWDINGAAVWPTRSISCSESSRFQQKDRLRIIVAPSAIQHWGTAAPSRSPPPCNSEMMPCSCSRPEWMKSSSSCKFLMTMGWAVWKQRPGGDRRSADKVADRTTPSFHPKLRSASRRHEIKHDGYGMSEDETANPSIEGTS
jgi:haloacid dehalogenase-like hydrolase